MYNLVSQSVHIYKSRLETFLFNCASNRVNRRGLIDRASERLWIFGFMALYKCLIIIIIIHTAANSDATHKTAAVSTNQFVPLSIVAAVTWCGLVLRNEIGPMYGWSEASWPLRVSSRACQRGLWLVRGPRWRPMLARWLGQWSEVTSSPASTWMGDRQGRPSAVDLCPFVGVDLNLWPTVHIAVNQPTNQSINQSINRSIVIGAIDWIDLYRKCVAHGHRLPLTLMN